jgi:DNA-binding response OmpR family regulator
VQAREAAAGDGVDLYVAPAATAATLPRNGPPVIACGSAALMRTAFLAGCEDYLRDPWTPEELSLRALAALARVKRLYRFPWGELSFEGNDVRAPGGLVPLTLHESRILQMLLRARGSPVPRLALAWSTGKAPSGPQSRAIDAHVSAIRGKLGAAVRGAGRIIVSVRGQGYLVP